LAPFLPLFAAYMVGLAVTRGFGTMLPSNLIDKLGRALAQPVLVAGGIALGLTGFGLAAAWAIPFAVGFVAVGIALAIGICVGALAGYFGGWTDIAVSRFIEIMVTIPTFFLILAIIAVLGPNIYNIMIVIGLTGWTGSARFIRAEFLRLKQLDFITALRALGASHKRIIFMHMLPNALAPVLVSAVFDIAGAILTESSLSFLGFGVPPPQPSWGDILSQSRSYIEFAWWLTVFPGLAIFLSITAYNLVGSGLRDAMDPKLFR
jgi:peptide/nickel transport system permease protein